MTIMEIFALSLALIVAEEFALARRLRLPGPLEGGYLAALTMGLAVTALLTVSLALCWVVGAFVLLPLGLEYLETAVCLLLTAGLAWAVDRLLRRPLPNWLRRLRRSLPLAAVNCAALAGALLTAGRVTGLSSLLRSGALAGVGFAAAGLLFLSLWKRLAFARVPRCFSGFPAAMAAAGLVLLTLLGFSGLSLW